EDGIRDATVTGVQTCALPIFVENSEVSLFLPILELVASGEPDGPVLAPVDRVRVEVALHALGPSSMITQLRGDHRSPSSCFSVRSEERRVGKVCLRGEPGAET